MTEQQVIQSAIDVLFLPLIGFVVLMLLGRKISGKSERPAGHSSGPGVDLAGWLGTAILFIALGLSSMVLYQKLTAVPESIDFTFPWVDFGNVPLIGSLQISLGITVDNLSAIMMVVVCLVSWSAASYSYFVVLLPAVPDRVWLVRLPTRS